MCREGAWAELTVKVTFVAIDPKPDARILNKAEISAFFCAPNYAKRVCVYLDGSFISKLAWLKIEKVDI